MSCRGASRGCTNTAQLVPWLLTLEPPLATASALCTQPRQSLGRACIWGGGGEWPEHKAGGVWSGCTLSMWTEPLTQGPPKRGVRGSCPNSPLPTRDISEPKTWEEPNTLCARPGDTHELTPSPLPWLVTLQRGHNFFTLPRGHS